MQKIGLVLEGGGFRGLFVEGFTDWLLDHNIEIPYVIGVSMGASNGVSYISKQKSRNFKIAEAFIKDPRYFSKKNLITQGSLFGMDFIFNDIAKHYNKFDFDTFSKSKQEFVIGAMNCVTGQSTFMKKSEVDVDTMMLSLRASISLPFISQLVEIEQVPHLDGGLSDPIPVKQALLDGCDKVIVVSSREVGYIKSPFKGTTLSKMIYHQYPEVTQALKNRHHVYAQTQSYLKELQASGQALVIQPKAPLQIGRLERDIKKVYEAFKAGYETAEIQADEILAFIK